MIHARCQNAAAKQLSWAILCISLSPLLTLAVVYMLGGARMQMLQRGLAAQSPRFFTAFSARGTTQASLRSVHRLNLGLGEGNKQSSKQAIAAIVPDQASQQRLTAPDDPRAGHQTNAQSSDAAAHGAGAKVRS